MDSLQPTYVIAWTSRSEPRMGQGKKLFTLEEATHLATELNQDYPEFIHTPFNLSPTTEASEPALEEAHREVIIRFPATPALAV